MKKNSFKSTLEKLCHNLYYSSESNYPFEVLSWGKIDVLEIERKITVLHPVGNLPEPFDLDDFFNKCIRNVMIGGGDRPELVAQQYRNLADFIHSNTKKSILYRCGKIQVGIYIVLITEEGKVFVLKTTSIET
jgi:hypothetical protein